MAILFVPSKRERDLFCSHDQIVMMNYLCFRGGRVFSAIFLLLSNKVVTLRQSLVGVGRAIPETYNKHLNLTLMKRVFILLCLMLGITCSYAANAFSVPELSTDLTNSSNSYTIHAAESTSNGEVSLSADSSGYAGTTAYATCSGTQPTRYEWSATFDGDCNRYYIWPNGARADISVYLEPGDTGGLMRVTCDMYNGSTYLGTGYLYVFVY